MSKREKTLISATENATQAVTDGAKEVTHAAKDVAHKSEHAVLEVAHKAKIVIKEAVKLVKGAADAVVVDAIHAAHDARGNVNAAIDRAKSTK